MHFINMKVFSHLSSASKKDNYQNNRSITDKLAVVTIDGILTDVLATIDHFITYFFVNIWNYLFQYVVSYFTILVYLYYAKRQRLFYRKRDIMV